MLNKKLKLLLGSLCFSLCALAPPGAALAQTAPGATAAPKASTPEAAAAGTAAPKAAKPVRVAAVGPKPGSDIKEPISAKGCAGASGGSKPYFVEFRSRTAASYGHTFVFYGRL